MFNLIFIKDLAEHYRYKSMNRNTLYHQFLRIEAKYHSKGNLVII